MAGNWWLLLQLQENHRERLFRVVSSSARLEILQLRIFFVFWGGCTAALLTSACESRFRERSLSQGHFRQQTANAAKSVAFLSSIEQKPHVKVRLSQRLQRIRQVR
jgi:hypothetical protein